MTIDESIKTISDVLNKLGVDPAAHQLPNSNGRGWAVPTEKSVLFATVGEAEGQSFFRLTCPILFMPSQDLLPFYRKMLDLNSELGGGSLAMEHDMVYLINQQALDRLTPDVLESIFQRMTKLAGVLADLLIQEFNSARYWRPM
jgi:hypothetical protein